MILSRKQDKMSWLSKHQEACSQMRDTASRVKGIAHAFHRIGNYVIADELLECAANISSSEEAASGAISQMLEEENARGRKQFADVLNTTLNMLDKRKNDVS
jgi:hypothetical protein